MFGGDYDSDYASMNQLYQVMTKQKIFNTNTVFDDMKVVIDDYIRNINKKYLRITQMSYDILNNI